MAPGLRIERRYTRVKASLGRQQPNPDRVEVAVGVVDRASASWAPGARIELATVRVTAGWTTIGPCLEWSPRQESNLRPMASEAITLSTELRRHGAVERNRTPASASSRTRESNPALSLYERAPSPRMAARRELVLLRWWCEQTTSHFSISTRTSAQALVFHSEMLKRLSPR
jgi:hypothetical protein